MVESGYTATQASYAYISRDLDEKFKTKKTIKVIELLENEFKKLSSSHQALLLTHEILHHTDVGSHAFITPIIQSANLLLPTFKKQKASPSSLVKLTSEEALAAGTAYSALQNSLCVQSHENGSKYINEKYCRPFQVDPQGGGIISAETKELLSLVTDNNYVDMSSRIHIDATTEWAPIIDKNALVSSEVSIKCSFNESTGARSQSEIRHNRLIKSELISRCTSTEAGLSRQISGNDLTDSSALFEAGGSFLRNRLVRSEAKFIDSSVKKQTQPQLSTDNALVDVKIAWIVSGSSNVIKSAFSPVALFGSQNRIEQVHSQIAARSRNTLLEIHAPLSLGSDNRVIRFYRVSNPAFEEIKTLAAQTCAKQYPASPWRCFSYFDIEGYDRRLSNYKTNPLVESFRITHGHVLENVRADNLDLAETGSPVVLKNCEFITRSLRFRTQHPLSLENFSLNAPRMEVRIDQLLDAQVLNQGRFTAHTKSEKSVKISKARDFNQLK